MEGVLLVPVFLSFEKLRWQKSIRNVAPHTDIILQGIALIYRVSSLLFSAVPTCFCEVETVFTCIQ